MIYPRGHTSAHADKTEPWHEHALVPLSGGATLDTLRPLPPLVLSKNEWQRIGLKMGWIQAFFTPLPGDPKGGA